MSNQKFSLEFKREAVRRVTSGRPMLEVAADLKVGKSTLWRWIREQGHEQQPADGTTSETDRELARLRRRVAELEEDREILKKATFFAKQSR